MMSPVTVKRLGCGGMLGMGLRSWAVTLAPCSVDVLDLRCYMGTKASD